MNVRNMEYGERLQALNLFSVKGRLLRADMIKCWKIFNGKSVIHPNDLWELNNNPRLRGHKLKINVRRCQVDARSRFFAERVVKDWNSLPVTVVESTSLTEFKATLASCLGNRLYEFVP